MRPPLDWLLDSREPWTRYRALVDLIGLPEDSPQAEGARMEMLAHPQVQQVVAGAALWGENALRRHNDASHALHKLTVLAQFGVRATDPGLPGIISAVLAHQSAEGAFQSVLNIAPAFGGSGSDEWSWMLCDAPVVVHSLLLLGLGTDERVAKAVEHLARQVCDNGWRCVAAPALGFRGPGRKADPCPMATLLCLKALGQTARWLDTPATRSGTEMILGHWERRAERKYYLFGIGTDFRKVKYPCIWYDLLHVVDVLSSFPFVLGDPRFTDMVAAVEAQADADGRYTASSAYQAWKGWSFADKKLPSPWLTLMVLRISDRCRRRPHGGPPEVAPREASGATFARKPGA